MAERWKPFLVYVVPLLGIFVVVVGSYPRRLGDADRIRGARLGRLGHRRHRAYGKFSACPRWSRALLETAKISVMILFIIAASVTFSQILAFSGATNGLLALSSRRSAPRPSRS